MGLIGTRSLNTEIPGIQELVQHAEQRIRDGILAYDALQTIRQAGSDAAIAPQARAAFEEHGNEMGYALLLKRYVDDPRQATPEQIAKAAWDTVPPVAPLFWSFRLMVAIGMFLIVLMGTFLVLSAKHQLGERRWLLKVALWSLPLPWLAVEAGWIVAELGRQPWVIEGVLPTAVAVSNLGVKTLLLTIAGFVAIYSVLLVIEIKLMLKTIRKGPQETPAPAPTPLTAPAAAPLAPAH